MPPTCPMIQLFGSGFGQAASTAKVGTSAAAAGRGSIPSKATVAATSAQILAKRAARRGKAADIGVMASSLLLFLLRSCLCAGSFQRIRVDQLEFLDALAFDLAGIDVARFVDGDDMQHQELSGVAPGMAERADDAAVVAFDHADLVVGAVGIEEIALLRIGPEREIEYRAVTAGVLLVEPFLHIGAVFFEDLDAVLAAVAGIDQSVIGDLHAMDGIAELLLFGGGRIVRRLLVVVGRLAGAAPVPLVGERGSVVHDDAAIAVAVGDVEFVGALVDGDFRRPAELARVVAVGARRDLADLAEIFAVEGELQNGAVIVGIAADPDEAALVDLDAVLAPDPFVAVARSEEH